MVRASTKENSNKERKLAGPDMSTTEMFMRVISLMESSMAKVNITLWILVKLMKANLSITKCMEKER